MADRFVFLPSLFLLAAMALLIQRVTVGKKGRDLAILLSILLIALPFSFAMTRERVAEWKDSLILYRADLKKVPNSFRVNAFNAMEEINIAQSMPDGNEKTEMYRLGIDLMEKAYSIYPDYKNMYFKWGIAYYGLGNIDSAEWAWGRLKLLWPDFQYNESNTRLINDARHNQQMAIYNANFQKRDYPFLSRTLNAALTYKPDVAPVWTLLGKVYYLQGKSDSARWAFSKAIELNPASEEDKRMLNLLK
jgi:tetratricopeptide (TPR) repeat protein